MHSILWASILASAVVAAIVTLLVEYFAKPALEARKERILETYREKRQAQKDIERCFLILSNLERNTGAASEDYIRKAATELSERITNAVQCLRPPNSIITEWVVLVRVLQDYEHHLKVESDPDMVRKIIDNHIARLHLFFYYFKSGKWEWERKRVLARRIKALKVEHRKVRSRTKKDNSLTD
jgi:hypothetical protein